RCRCKGSYASVRVEFVAPLEACRTAVGRRDVRPAHEPQGPLRLAAARSPLDETVGARRCRLLDRRPPCDATAARTAKKVARTRSSTFVDASNSLLSALREKKNKENMDPHGLRRAPALSAWGAEPLRTR